MILPPRPMLGVQPWLGLYPRAGSAAPVDPGLALLNTATSWYDAHDGSGLQEVPSRVGAGVAQLGSTTGVDTNDPTWTTGTPPYWALTTDDYLLLDAIDTPTFTGASGEYTVLIIAPTTFASVHILWSSESASTNGATIRFQTGTMRSRAGASESAGPTNPANDGVVRATALVKTAGFVTAYDSTGGFGTPTATAGTWTHVQPKVGVRAYDDGVGRVDPVYAVATWNGTALTESELDDVSAYLLGSYS